jgi:hypothetical protein
LRVFAQGDAGEIDGVKLDHVHAGVFLLPHHAPRHLAAQRIGRHDHLFDLRTGRHRIEDKPDALDEARLRPVSLFA